MTSSSDPSDERALLRRLRRGDHCAFLSLYNRYKKRIAVKLLTLLKSEDLAQDALQEIFMKIWEKRAYINPELSFPAFLYRLARNEVSDIIRRAHQDERLMQHLLRQSPVSENPIEAFITREENVSLVQHALQQLPQRQRQVFILHKIEGKSYKEISELLNISPAAINQHIYRAMQRLSSILNPTLCAVMTVALSLMHE
ncbi:RNA polymerase sigma factor [Parapedobacter deserti]|uniref:RNA polymerase sigma factor n=1 Tax=Parapedobacter deserti TaxID=1912957 RepID=A0ABV7JM43_9SPHI